MNKNVIIDFENNTITLTRTFARKAKIYGTPEQKILEDLQAKYSNYTIKVKAPVNRENYTGLTILFMRKCVEFAYTEKDVANFDKIVDLYNEHRAKTPKIKSYFLDTYKDWQIRIANSLLEKELTEGKQGNENTSENMDTTGTQQNTPKITGEPEKELTGDNQSNETPTTTTNAPEQVDELGEEQDVA